MAEVPEFVTGNARTNVFSFEGKLHLKTYLELYLLIIIYLWASPKTKVDYRRDA